MTRDSGLEISGHFGQLWSGCGGKFGRLAQIWPDLVALDLTGGRYSRGQGASLIVT